MSSDPKALRLEPPGGFLGARVCPRRCRLLRLCRLVDVPLQRVGGLPRDAKGQRWAVLDPHLDDTFAAVAHGRAKNVARNGAEYNVTTSWRSVLRRGAVQLSATCVHTTSSRRGAVSSGAPWGETSDKAEFIRKVPTLGKMPVVSANGYGALEENP